MSTEQFDPRLLTDDEIRALPEWSYPIHYLNLSRAVARAQLAKAAANATAAAPTFCSAHQRREDPDCPRCYPAAAPKPRRQKAMEGR